MEITSYPCPKTLLEIVLKDVRIDYRQDCTFYCSPNNSFSGRGWKTLFEYDESVWSLSRRQNRSPQSYEFMMSRDQFTAALTLLMMSLSNADDISCNGS